MFWQDLKETFMALAVIERVGVCLFVGGAVVAIIGFVLMHMGKKTRKRVDTDELPMHCEWCGDEIDDSDVWDDGQEHFFDSEMCLGQYEAERP